MQNKLIFMDGILKKEKEAKNHLHPKFPYNMFRSRNPIKAADIFYELGHLYSGERKIRKSVNSFQRAAELYEESGERYYIHLAMQSHVKCAELFIEKKNIESTVSIEKYKNVDVEDGAFLEKGAIFYEKAGLAGERCESFSVAANYFKKAAELFTEAKVDFHKIIFAYKKAADNYSRAKMRLNCEKMCKDLYVLSVDNKFYRECLTIENISEREKFLLHKLINKNYALHDDEEFSSIIENKNIEKMKKIMQSSKNTEKQLLENLITKYENERDIL